MPTLMDMRRAPACNTLARLDAIAAETIKPRAFAIGTLMLLGFFVVLADRCGLLLGGHRLGELSKMLVEQIGYLQVNLAQSLMRLLKTMVQSIE